VPYFESPAPLAVTQVVEPRSWATTDWVVFHGSTRIVRVPPGSRTDWASVPGWAAWLIDPRDAAAAALVHDYCYRVLVPAGEMTYREADRILLEAMAALKVPPASALLTWDAVRLYSIVGEPGGRIGLWEDLASVLATTAWGALLAAPALCVMPSMKALQLANRLLSR